MRLSQAQLARIKSLENTHGRLTARRVLDDAKQKTSPLHTLAVFRGWDEKHATQKWWLHCARLVIASVTVQVVHNHATIRVPCYVSDPDTLGDGYRTVVALRSETGSARESLVDALETAHGHILRAFTLAGPLGLQKEVDALLASVAGVMRIAKAKKAA